MTRSSLVDAMAVPAAPVRPVARAGAQHTPGGAPSRREVDRSPARPAPADALLAAYVCATWQAQPRGFGEAPAQGG